MKKNWFSIISMVLVTLVVASCSSGPKMYDPSVPLEQSSTLLLGDPIDGFINVGKFNEKKVLWKSGNPVIIPAGTHTLLLASSKKEFGSNSTEIGSVEMTHTFLAGHTYTVAAPISGGKINGQITDITRLLLDFPQTDTANPDASPFEGEWVDVGNARSPHFIFAGDEWAMTVNGEYRIRGLFSQDRENITLLILTAYDAKKGKWVVSKLLTSDKITYNGTSLIYYNTVYKRLE